jgi:hypothetical protein
VADNCGGATLVPEPDVNVPGNCPGTYTLTKRWHAMDGCGNVSPSVSQTIHVVDTTAPTITSAGPDDTIQCPNTPVFGTPTVADNCGGATLVPEPDVNVPGNCPGTYTLTKSWHAMDGCGNVSPSVSQTITVQDTTGPAIQCPQTIPPLNAGNGCYATLLPPPASDDCSGVADISVSNVSPPLPLNTPPNQYPVGTWQVTWTATDGCGNPTTCTTTVTVLGQLCIRKFYDANANGLEDGTDSGIGNWKFVISGGLSQTVHTASSGSIGTVCINVPAGQYTVTEVAPSGGWQNTTPLSSTVTFDPQNPCSQVCTFGNYCFKPPFNGLTLGFWSNKNGAKILSQNPGWVSLLNNLGGPGGCLRNANGTVHTFSTFADLNTWLLGGTATNMAYMLSVQLAANVLDEAYNQLSGSTNVVVAGGSKTGANVCIVGFLSTVQPISCGSPALLSLTSVAGSGACGCSYNNGLVTIDDLQARAVCLLQAYPNTIPASTQRTYQECVKDILDMINNNGNNGYACGGVTQFINSSQTICPFQPY